MRIKITIRGMMLVTAYISTVLAAFVLLSESPFLAMLLIYIGTNVCVSLLLYHLVWRPKTVSQKISLPKSDAAESQRWNDEGC